VNRNAELFGSESTSKINEFNKGAKKINDTEFKRVASQED
jgi:hypothetical protein